MDFALSIVNRDGKLVADSREVARMIGKRHDHLVRDIQGYIAILNKSSETLATQQTPNLGTANFFLESSYKADDGSRSYPCYLLTKQGCEMVANKLTGEKGVLFTAAYVQQFNAMQEKMATRQTQLMSPTQMLRLQLEAMESLEKAQRNRTTGWTSRSSGLTG